MATIVDLLTAAKHLRLDLDDDPELAGNLLDSAESLVLEHIEKSSAEITEEYGESIPSGLKLGLLVVMLNLHDNPEADPLSDAAISLLRPYRSVGVW